MENNADSVENIQNILNKKQLKQILNNTAKPGAEIIGYDIKPASAGLAGFLGNHLRLTLHIMEDVVRQIHLFVKSLPKDNQPKADYITQSNFNKREALAYKLFEEMEDTDDSNPWRTKAYIYDETVLVMPDLCAEGYKSYPVADYLDKNHLMITMTSTARFHAAFSNYVTKKTISENKPFNFLDEYGHIMTEPMLFDTPWLRAAAKLTRNFLKEFSTKFEGYPIDLEERLVNLYIKACDDLKVYEDTVNVLIHKDLWVNNILFRYSGDEVTNAVLIDYQCIRFGPPAFDVMLCLYLTTSRSFRENYESEILHHYYSVFMESLGDDTKTSFHKFNYNLDTFLFWSERARLFGMLLPIGIFPVILMEPVIAQKIFDDPETYMDLMEKDRSKPVIEHARTNNMYRKRQLEVSEELVEKYIMSY